jgi:hypothetical protein
LQSVQQGGHYRIDHHCIDLAAQPEEAAHDQTQRYARAARIDAPATVERNRALVHA